MCLLQYIKFGSDGDGMGTVAPKVKNLVNIAVFGGFGSFFMSIRIKFGMIQYTMVHSHAAFGRIREEVDTAAPSLKIFL